MIGRCRRQRRRGAAIVEMAAVIPVFVLLVFGMMDAARLFMVGHQLTIASREGCRVAVTNGYTSADVTTRVNILLTGYGINPSDTTLSLSPTPIETTPLGTPITVTLSIPFSKVSYLGTPFLFGSTTISMAATMSSQRP